jgi:hypothetical protein
LNCQSSVAGLRVDGLEAAVHRAVEDDVAGGRERAAPDRKRLLDAQRLARDRVPRGELAALAAGPAYILRSTPTYGVPAM